MLIEGLAIVHALVVIAFSTRILLRDDLSSAARLAWFLVMLFAPYVGVVLYLLFGEISLGRTVHRRHDKIIAKLRRMAGAAMGSCDQNFDVVNACAITMNFFFIGLSGKQPSTVVSTVLCFS